jgi:Fe2+ transport system protein FeoA
MYIGTHDSSPVSLDTLRPGEKAIVSFIRLSGSPELRQKLLIMGLVPGQSVEVMNLAPLGDPMTVRLLGFQLALRLDEAACVVVERR